MPHLNLEYTANLSSFDAQNALIALNQTLIEIGEFNEKDIKSRAIKHDDFLIGAQQAHRAFIHLKLHLLSGRSTETKQLISQQLLSSLSQHVQQHQGIETQLCVEIIDIDRNSYSKAVI